MPGGIAGVPVGDALVSSMPPRSTPVAWTRLRRLTRIATVSSGLVQGLEFGRELQE